ncbi:MAG: sulfatase [Planctomycetes bacterium]|nr:sulfatase [Planctomycetota bacterium]
MSCMFRYSVCLCALVLVALPADGAESRKPNIIVIFCDDLGYGDLGCYGAADIRTPHLDRMAKEGMLLTDFSMVAPLCTPSRAAFMTGRYPGRMGLATGVLRPNAKTGMPVEEITLGEVAKSAGYVSGLIGKWHLGFIPGIRPLDQGFDSYFGVLHNLDHYETVFFESEGGMPVLRGDTVVERPADPSRITSLYTEEALRFIDHHRNEPFFLFISHQMPHLPFDASPAFKGRSHRGLYGDVVEELDDSTGQILDRLRTHALQQNTLVLFTSDNGPERNTPGSAGPLRGTKHTVFEGGLRVPCLAWWPETIPADRRCEEFLTALDVLPTLARICGAELPDSLVLDGLDATQLLCGEKGADSHNERTLHAVYGLNKNRLESFRSGSWKLHLTQPPQLYDLANDIGEQENLATAMPDHVHKMQEQLRRWQQEFDASLPGRN